MTKRETDDARDRAKSLVRQIDKEEGMVREVRERERNTCSKAIRGIIE